MREFEQPIDDDIVCLDCERSDDIHDAGELEDTRPNGEPMHGYKCMNCGTQWAE